jgi:hypothetical protein
MPHAVELVERFRRNSRQALLARNHVEAPTVEVVALGARPSRAALRAIETSPSIGECTAIEVQQSILCGSVKPSRMMALRQSAQILKASNNSASIFTGFKNGMLDLTAGAKCAGDD